MQVVSNRRSDGIVSPTTITRRQLVQLGGVTLVATTFLAGCTTAMGGLAAPLAPWLPHRVRGCLSEAKNDSLDGAILMARQTFFKTHSVMSRAS